jgi:cell division septation protein DedD
MDNEESDITIGPLKLLGLFFMLVAICGVFFAIGYSLGKTSAHEQALNDKAAINASASAPVVGNPNAAKPSAGLAAKTQSEGNSSTESSSDPTSPDLTFFNAVKRTDRNSPASTADGKTTTKPEPATTTGAAKGDAQPTVVEAAAKSAPKPQAAPAVTPLPGGGFVVQIAAVTREEDAAALAGALRKKNYSVFVVNNPEVHDKFYHVQVGPFPSLQDAEAMKARLTGEGYNPIVKKS